MIGLAFMLLLGATLRLIWPGDMEFKGDEIYTFDRTQKVGVSESWPWVGMNNSADVPHPGMSVWVFIGLAQIFGAHDPVTLNVGCMMLNVIALFMLVAFVASVVPSEEREPWWWAIAIVAVNPLAVIFHRKIWPPSILPVFSVLLLLGWWYRGRKFWALFWGFIAAIAAQIHPGAFFFSAGMALWALVFDRQSVRWLWTSLGGLLGTLTAWPWAFHLITSAEHSAATRSRWFHPFEFRFWTYWVTEPFGFNLQYSLGNDFDRFMQSPVIGGQPTYLVGCFHLVMFVAMCWILARWLMGRMRSPITGIDRTQTGFSLGAIVWGYGTVLTFSGFPIHRHYMIITFPFMFVWLARVAMQTHSIGTARKLLTGVCVVQAGITGLLLCFLHQIDRPVRGDYGAPYRVQIDTERLHATKGH